MPATGVISARAKPHRSPSAVPRYRKNISAFLALTALALATSRAGATPSDCAVAYEDGQRLMGKAQLLEAARQFRFCGSPACPNVMHAECLRFLDRVEAVTPSVVVRVGPEGALPAKISIDGGPDVALDGRAVLLDPGTHRLRVSAPGYSASEQQFLVAEGESLKVIEARLDAISKRAPASTVHLSEPASAPPSAPSAIPWVVTAAIAGVGATGFAYWGLTARSGERDLDRCRPDCPRSQVDTVKRDYLLANVSLGVGVSGLIGMAIWYVVAPSGSARRATGFTPINSAPGSAALSLGWTLPL